MIDLFSDTQTLPTPEMLEGIRNAKLGDGTDEEDPTVARLESASAAMLGKEAALLVISGHMGNLVSLMSHAHPGDEVLLDAESHIFHYEVGSIASLAGLMPKLIPSHGGMLCPDELKASIRPPDLHYPVPRLLCLENSHNRSGGRVIPLALHQELCRIAHENGLAVHLDGARIFNAAIASGVSASAFAEDADSVMFCLTKGLSCPLGSVLVGSGEFISRAKRARKRLGGGMRQAGVIAACGIVALDSMIDRLADDHRTARRLALGINQIPGLHVGVNTVETNILNVDHSASELDTSEILARLKAAGVLASSRPPSHVRLVTHRHIDDTTVDQALERIEFALHSVSPPSGLHPSHPCNSSVE
jgi:threonine aldolase